MTNINLGNIIEALIFSSDRPLLVKEIKDLINEEKASTGITADIKTIESVISELMEKFEGREYSFRLQEIAGGYRFSTKKDYSVWLAKLNKEKLKRKLSQSALETLSIIAYNQPITKSEIESIRGVNVDYIVGALLEKNLVTIKGRADAPGRPMLYGTTSEFLEYMGLNSLADLPPLKEISEIIKSGPPEGVTQSDIDFFEEINLIRSKMGEGESKIDETEMVKEMQNKNPDEQTTHDENETGTETESGVEE